MTIALAEWSDILTVLHESYHIWSPGLRKMSTRNIFGAR